MATKKKAATKKRATKKRATKKNPTRPAPKAASQPASDPTVTRIREIVEIFDGSGLAELEYEDESLGLELRLSRYASTAPAAPAAPPPMAPAPLSPAPAPAAPAAEAAPAADAPGVVIKSPFVGTFYRAPSPEAPPFCEVGQRVLKGQTLCIVEAMKLMNEIPSEADGKVVEVLVENGEPVQYGDALFKIAPN